MRPGLTRLARNLRIAGLMVATAAMIAGAPAAFAEDVKPKNFAIPIPEKPADPATSPTKGESEPTPDAGQSAAEAPRQPEPEPEPVAVEAPRQPEAAPVAEPEPVVASEPEPAPQPAKAETAPAKAEPAPVVRAAATAHSYPKDVEVPADPVAKAAFDVLEKHCARCHQAGMLTSREKPAKNFGNILKLDELAADPSRVQAGNADGSKLMQQLINKEMPYDLYYEFDSSKPEVTAGDIDALRAWITSAGDREAAACKGRTFIKPTDVVSYIGADLKRQQDFRVRNMRYITLTNIYNSCATDEAMEVYRQGTVKLLNSFGRKSDVVRLTTIDPAKTIIAFNLDDLGWDPSDWDTVLSVYPYATRPDTNEFDFISQQTYTVLPYVRGDWFGFTASQPPLYDVLLKLPKTFPELADSLGVDVIGNIRNYVAQRAGFQKSGVSQNNRLIERHPISTGYFWTSYDMAGNRGIQSLFLNPLGPDNSGFEHAFHHDGGETIYSLPNNFQAYYLNTSDGKRLDKGPVAIVRDASRRDFSVTNGISCMGCHDQGIRKAKDDIRAVILKDRSFSKESRDAVDALYPEHAKMDAMLEDDFGRFNTAMKRAGLDSTLKLNGVEMVNALFKRYEDDLSLRKAAAEYGYGEDEFKEAFLTAGPEAIALMRRLEQGIVPRDQFETQYIQFVEGSTDEKVIDVAQLKVAEKVEPPKHATQGGSGGTFDLRLNADKTTYNQGEAAVFTVYSGRACNLFVVNVSKDGTGTIIFPNSYQKDNAIRADETVTLGGSKSPFKFKLPDIGKERVVAVCRVGGNAREAFGQEIDTNSTFTEVQNFDKAVSRQIAVEANDVREEAAGLDADSRKDAQYAKIATLAQKKAAKSAPESAKQTVASAAIVIQVK